MKQSETKQQTDLAATLWIAAVAAAGVGAAAAWWLRRVGADATRRGVDEVLKVCDDAVDALEDRIGFRQPQSA